MRNWANFFPVATLAMIKRYLAVGLSDTAGKDVTEPVPMIALYLDYHRTIRKTLTELVSACAKRMDAQNECQFSTAEQQSLGNVLAVPYPWVTDGTLLLNLDDLKKYALLDERTRDYALEVVAHRATMARLQSIVMLGKTTFRMIGALEGAKEYQSELARLTSNLSDQYDEINNFYAQQYDTQKFSRSLVRIIANADEQSRVIKKRRGKRNKPATRLLSPYLILLLAVLPNLVFGQVPTQQQDKDQIIEIRKRLDKAEAWVRPDGSLPPPQYLSVLLNPTSVEKAKEYILFQREKAQRTILVQQLLIVISIEEQIKSLEKNLSASAREKHLPIAAKIEQLKKQLPPARALYRTILRAYDNYKPVLLENPPKYGAVP